MASKMHVPRCVPVGMARFDYRQGFSFGYNRPVESGGLRGLSFWWIKGYEDGLRTRVIRKLGAERTLAKWALVIERKRNQKLAECA